MNTQAPDALLAVLSVIGLALVVIGISTFGYSAYFVYQVVYYPETLEIWNYIASNIKIGDNAFHVSMVYPEASENSYEFDVQWSESVRLGFFSFILVLLFVAMVSISSTFINTGTGLLKLGMFNNKKSSKNDDLV